MSPRRRRGDLAPCFPVEEKSPRSQPSRFWCNKRVQSRKYAPSVKSTMQLIQIYHALIQIVSLWQLIVTSVTQLHWKGQTVHERYLPGSSTTHLILFYCGWNKAHTPAVPGRHRPTRSSSGTLTSENIWFSSLLFVEGSGHLHCSLASTDGKDAVCALETFEQA